MAKGTLLTNCVDDILNASMDGKRRYNLIPNDDGTYSLEDVTTYDQIGSDFGSAIVNAICKAVNESADKNKILETLDEVVATTKKGYIPDALAVKELNNSLTWDNYTFTKNADATMFGTINIVVYYSPGLYMTKLYTDLSLTGELPAHTDITLGTLNNWIGIEISAIAHARVTGETVGVKIDPDGKLLMYSHDKITQSQWFICRGVY